MLANKLFETLNRKRQVRTAFISNHGVDFVENHGASGFQHATPAVAGQQDVERFWSGDDDMWRTLRHRRAFGRWRVAGANKSANVHLGESEIFEFFLNSLERHLEIPLHVVAE